MGEVTIRVPSLEQLFDEWSAEPLERRPLNDDARERILGAWDEGHVNGQPPDHLCLVIASGDRSEGLERSISTAFHHDMEQMSIDTRHHWIRRVLAARESRIGFVVFLVAMVVSVVISNGDDGSAFETMIAQTFVVIAWVALWGPAGHFIRGTSYRLQRSSFAELAKVPVDIRWE